MWYFVVHTDRFLTYLGLAESVSQARRLRESGAVRMEGPEGEMIKIVHPKFAVIESDSVILNVGKRWLKVVFPEYQELLV